MQRPTIMHAHPGDRPDAGLMPLAGHLVEARRRLFRAGLAIALAAVAGYLLSDSILEIVRAPIVQLAESRNASLNYDTVSGAFELTMRIALYTGVVLASPIWLYQAFAFFVPALTRKEKRLTVGFLASAVPLFFAGCVAGFALFPHVVELMAGFASTDDSTILQASYYFDFVLKLVVAVGVAFVLPVFVVLLNFAGVLPGMAVVASWRVVLVAIVLFCALATPAADIMSMVVLALPMTALFAVAAGVAVLHDRRIARRLALDRKDTSCSDSPLTSSLSSR